ncbi:hypothetical protein V1477_008360 [Vespula maculifrons]|uniref:Uncharacterized protein n=1 Tax=Vespula maculifrons TaxID=7453 RepID=A0ABD2CCT0_VESMC
MLKPRFSCPQELRCSCSVVVVMNDDGGGESDGCSCCVVVQWLTAISEYSKAHNDGQPDKNPGTRSALNSRYRHCLSKPTLLVVITIGDGGGGDGDGDGDGDGGNAGNGDVDGGAYLNENNCSTNIANIIVDYKTRTLRYTI